MWSSWVQRSTAWRSGFVSYPRVEGWGKPQPSSLDRASGPAERLATLKHTSGEAKVTRSFDIGTASYPQEGHTKMCSLPIPGNPHREQVRLVHGGLTTAIWICLRLQRGRRRRALLQALPSSGRSSDPLRRGLDGLEATSTRAGAVRRARVGVRLRCFGQAL